MSLTNIPLPSRLDQLGQLSTTLLNSFDLVRRLVHSGTTTVYEVISTRGRLRGRHLALKQVAQSQNIAPSVSLHSALCHPNILALHSVIESSPPPHIIYWHVLEFCSEGNLFDLLHSRNPPACSEAELRQITKGITSALVYLKQERIIHRNIDSTNILLGQGCKPKLCDFKHAIHLHPRKKYVSQPLTGTTHPAPELLAISSQYNFAVDAWSFGCVLYACIGGATDSISTLYSSGNLFSTFPESPSELRCLIHSLIASSDTRLGVEQIAKHAYLTIDTTTLRSNSSNESLQTFSAAHISSSFNFKPLRLASATTVSLPDHGLQETQKSDLKHIYAPFAISRSRKRAALKNIGNIPLPRFLHAQLELTKDSTSNPVKINHPRHSTMNKVPPSLEDSQSSVTFLEKLSKAENCIPDVHEADKPTSIQFKRTTLPIGTTRPLPIDMSSLTPKVHKLANGTITILASHALLVDFRQNQRRHGHKGDQIMLVEGNRVSIFDAPHLSVPSCLVEPVRRYDIHDLPPIYWKQYNDAANFVDQIRRKVPHVTVYESEAKCTLMSNSPPSDIEIILYGEDSLVDKTKVRGSKAKSPTPTMRIQYSRQRHSLELAQKLTGDRGTEWKKERRTCLDSNDISRILVLEDTNQLAGKGLTVLLDFLKTCDRLESTTSSETKRATLADVPLNPVPVSKSQPATLPCASVLPFILDNNQYSLEDSRYLESVGWCIRCRGHHISDGTKYQILFLDGASLVVDLGRNALIFSSLQEDPIRCQISVHGHYPLEVKKYAGFINDFVALF